MVAEVNESINERISKLGEQLQELWKKRNRLFSQYIAGKSSNADYVRVEREAERLNKLIAELKSTRKGSSDIAKMGCEEVQGFITSVQKSHPIEAARVRHRPGEPRRGKERAGTVEVRGSSDVETPIAQEPTQRDSGRALQAYLQAELWKRRRNNPLRSSPPAGGVKGNAMESTNPLESALREVTGSTSEMSRDIRATISIDDWAADPVDDLPHGARPLRPGWKVGYEVNASDERKLDRLYRETLGVSLEDYVADRIVSVPIRRGPAAERMQRDNAHVDRSIASTVDRFMSEVELETFGGWSPALVEGFKPREQRGGKSLSMHALGTGIDIDAHFAANRWEGRMPSEISSDPKFRRLPAQPSEAQLLERYELLQSRDRVSFPPEVVLFFTRRGFAWGGAFNDSLDPMHFELIDPERVR